MATPKKSVINFEKCCRMCKKELALSKQGHIYLTKRRDLTSASSLLNNLQEFLPGFQPESGKAYICMECVNKLNKYDRIKCKYFSIKSEYEIEKDSIFNMFKSTEGKIVKRVLLTPHRPRSNVKVYKTGVSADALQHMNTNPSNIPLPTGVNKENIIFSSAISQKSPTKIPVPTYSSSPVKTTGARRKLPTTKYTPSFVCQVTYNFPSQTKRKIIDKSPTYLKITRSIIDDRPNQLALAVWHDEELRMKIVELVSTSINKECNKLCEINKDSKLQQVEASQLLNLLSFEFSEVLDEWKLKAPNFLKVITSAVTTVTELENKHIINIAFAGSIWLRGRNKKISAVAHIVGLLLDYGGANDETIDRLNRLGACVSTGSVYNKKN